MAPRLVAAATSSPQVKPCARSSSSPRASGDDGSVVGSFSVSLASWRGGSRSDGGGGGDVRQTNLVSRLSFRPEIRRDYPLNLSILLSGGKETNKDSPSNGE